MKLFVAICLGCALVAVCECQDLTSLMFQAMGLEPPLLPPVMPSTLREHLYPRLRRQQLLEQQQQQLQRQQQQLQQQQQQLQQQQQQKQRYMAYLASQQQRQVKANPYSIPYSPGTGAQPRANSVYSSANKIRYPGSPNSVTLSKGNPYSTAYQPTSVNQVTSPRNGGNPYSVSRAAGSGVPSVRNSVNAASMPRVQMPPQALKMMRTMQTLRAVREHPRRLTDAESAGCVLPGDSTAVSILMYGNCRDPAARMICQTEMMSCMNVGMSAMCCPFGVNNLALDTIGYVNKLQHFVSEFV